MSFTLDTPAQITMWVLLSRRYQLHMQLKGYPTAGLVKWVRENVPDSTARTAKVALVDLNDHIGELNGPEDETMNYRVYYGNHAPVPYLLNAGVFSTVEAIEGAFGHMPALGFQVIINRTLDEVTAI